MGRKKEGGKGKEGNKTLRKCGELVLVSGGFEGVCSITCCLAGWLYCT